MQKNIKFLKGPKTKVKPQFDKNYCEKQSKRTFFRVIFFLKLALRKIEIIGFKICLKNKMQKKSFESSSRS